MSGKPLTHAERGRLGGMKAAQQMTPEQRSYRAYQGAAGLSDRLAERGVPPQPPCSLAAWQRWRAPIAE